MEQDYTGGQDIIYAKEEFDIRNAAGIGVPQVYETIGLAI